MKKTIALLLILSVIFCSSCSVSKPQGSESQPDNPTSPEEYTGNGLFDVLIGENLKLTSINNFAPELVNDSGMSGLWSSNHLHAAFDGTTEKGAEYIDECMYSATEAYQGLFFDIGSIQALGQLCIWNYCDISDLDSCVKDVEILYSEDYAEFKSLGKYTLAKSNADDAAKHGGCIASNLDKTGLPIDFGGISARYIAIVPMTNYGGSKFGLSEIRLFRHKTRPSENDLIYTDAFTPRIDSNASNISNNTGMSVINATASSNETASNNPIHMWYTDKSPEESLVVINFDGTYPVNTLKFWNYNDPTNLDAGIKEFDVYYTTGEACNISRTETNRDYLDFSRGSWEHLGRYELEKGTGEDKLASSLTIDLDGIHIQHLKIVPVSNHKGTDNEFGLSEIRAYSGKGWAIEPARLWSGVVSTSGSFKYQGNKSQDPYATHNQGEGWLGADGIFSTSLNGSQLQGSVNENSITLFTFQDSFVGNMGNYRTHNMIHGYGNSNGFSLGMKNMAYMFLDGNLPDVRNVQYYITLNNNLSQSHPLNNILPGSYWIGDSTVIDGKVYTVANKFQGLALVSKDFYIQSLDESGKVTMNEVAIKSITELDSDLPGNMNFEPLYEEGEYIYQYGRKDNKLVVRRTTIEEYKTSSGWKYWNGEAWVDGAENAAKISRRSIGNEFNVTYMKTGAFAGKYVAVYTDGSIWGSVTCAVSDSITGPFDRLDEFSDTKTLYWATERYKMYTTKYKESSNYYTQWNYNAKSQPAISPENELLITYHFGLHDDRVQPWGFFSACGKEYEQPTFINLVDIK